MFPVLACSAAPSMTYPDKYITHVAWFILSVARGDVSPSSNLKNSYTRLKVHRVVSRDIQCVHY